MMTDGVASPPTGGPASQAGSNAGASPEHKHMSRRKHLVLDVCIILGVLIAYVFSLLGYDGWPTHRVRFRSGRGATDSTVVLIRFEELHTVANRLDVKSAGAADDLIVDHRLKC